MCFGILTGQERSCLVMNG